MKKICPIFSMGEWRRNKECLEDKCAWWVERHPVDEDGNIKDNITIFNCVIKDLAKNRP